MTLGARANEIRLRPDEFRLLRDLVNGYAGIYFGDEALAVLERRLRERVVAAGLKSFAEYYQFLRFSMHGASELDEAVDLLTTNETYFFREDYQLRAFKDEVLPELSEEAASRRRLSVWSAGCSTGEEVYTLGILIADSGLFTDWEVRVYGSDISRRCVAAARRGIYGASAFRATPPEWKRANFVDLADGSHVVDRVRQYCHFGHLNLMDSERVRVVGRVDAVFCRNVLIYFDQRSRKRVIDMFYERLVPGGYLFLGHSESLLNVSTAFELVHLSEDLVYRKPLVSMPVRRTGGGL
ncbi:MAG TPA: protein-glutamate O-methyltransferase CheR [Polyangiaceae bacterium]|nr:protein-glutamate O-methyltransferase CheR [Polyangiaceae bacterium]